MVLWRRLSLCLPSWLGFFMLSSSLLFPGLLGVSTSLLHLWPWIWLLFVSSLTLLWLLPLPRVAAVPLHHQRSLWESTCSRCWSHLSPNFGIRGCSSSAPIHLLVVSAHLLFLANWMVTAWPPLRSPPLAYYDVSQGRTKRWWCILVIKNKLSCSIILLHMEFQPLFLFLTLAKLGPYPALAALVYDEDFTYLLRIGFVEMWTQI